MEKSTSSEKWIFVTNYYSIVIFSVFLYLYTNQIQFQMNACRPFCIGVFDFELFTWADNCWLCVLNKSEFTIFFKLFAIVSSVAANSATLCRSLCFKITSVMGLFCFASKSLLTYCYFYYNMEGHSAYKTIQKADEGNDAFPNQLLIWNYTDSPITLIVLQHLMLGVHDCLPQHQMKPLTFFKCTEAFLLDARKMNKYIFAIITFNKAITFSLLNHFTIPCCISIRLQCA